jgi:hypothetical protein
MHMYIINIADLIVLLRLVLEEKPLHQKHLKVYQGQA